MPAIKPEGGLTMKKLYQKRFISSLFSNDATALLFFILVSCCLISACSDGNPTTTNDENTQAFGSDHSTNNDSSTSDDSVTDGNTPSLSITRTIGGTVSGSGIECGTTCQTDFDQARNIQLSAQPQEGFVFAGWEGDCAGNGTCVLTVDSPKEVRAQFRSVETQDLCHGLVTDLQERTIEPIPQPGLKESYIDPSFGTKITRITQSQPKQPIKTMYSTIQAWNSNESFFILYEVGRGHRLYNGNNYDFVGYLDIASTDIEGVYWHHSDPNLVLYIDNTQQKLVQYNVLTRAKTERVDLNSVCASNIKSGSDIQMISWDSNNIGFRCNGRGGKFAGYINVNQKSVTTLSSNNGKIPDYIAPMPSASGQYFYLDGEIYDRNLQFMRRLDLPNGLEHANLGQNHLGEDAYFTAMFDPGQNCAIGSVVMHNLSTGSCQVLAGPSTGLPYPPPDTHISAQASQNLGWLAVSTIGEGDELPRRGTRTPVRTTVGEIYLVGTDASKNTFCRVAHHRTFGKSGQNGYWAEPHPAISPSGTRILFGSDFHNSGTTDTYVIELPSYR